jgi:uncharacterized protein YukE
MAKAEFDQLIAGLEDYLEGLRKHRKVLQSVRESTGRKYRALNAVWGGKAARSLHAQWSRTGAWFEDYLTRTNRLAKLLEERIEALRKANKEEFGMGL